MKEIEMFRHPRFGEIRCVVDENGDPWFVGKDVAECLGYSNSRDAIRKHVDDVDKTSVAICDSGSNYKSQGVEFWQSGQWHLYAKYSGMGFTQSRTYPYEDSDGAIRTAVCMVWTEKGKRFLSELIRSGYDLEMALGVFNK